VLACDLHPEYLSTKYARSRRNELPVYGVQHHHAHIAACLAENGECGPVIGLSLDGTGYGTDGRIWGGEVLVADLRDFERAGHFRYVPMPGGNRAIREPWRMAVSYLHHALGPGFAERPFPFLDEIAPDNLRLVVQMMERRMNSPETSSCGRLFDALAAISGLRQRVTFEGQAAMEFEMCLDESDAGRPYPFPFADGVIEVAPAIRAAADDVLVGVTAAGVSARLHRGLVRLFADLGRRLAEDRGIPTVALSGGVFQNLWLLRHLCAELQAAGLRVLLHRLVPCNDGGIALGQLAVAAERHLTGWEEPCV
jgi:hydrogenase maturation protein HypF